MLLHVRYKIPQGFYNKALLKWMKNNCETLPVIANDNTNVNCSDKLLRDLSKKYSSSWLPSLPDKEISVRNLFV